jgi:hypothetical protein
MPEFQVSLQVKSETVRLAVGKHLGLVDVDLSAGVQAEKLGEMLFAALGNDTAFRAEFRTDIDWAGNPLDKRVLYITVFGETVEGLAECVKRFQVLFDSGNNSESSRT